MRVGHRKGQVMIRDLELPAPSSLSAERGEGLGMKSVTDRDHVMNSGGLGGFQVREHMQVLVGDAPRLRRDRAPGLGALPDLARVSLHPHPLSRPLLCNKLVTCVLESYGPF